MRRKLTIKEMQMLARKRGGKCLSQEYQSIFTKLLWECAEEHQWKAKPNNIKWGQWCPECAGNKKLTIEEMQEIARERGGKCLSQEYINNSTKLLWECREGHQWEAAPNHIRDGTWCPACVGQRKPTIEEMQEIARERGGKCLSQEYVNSYTKLLWECTKGHQWKARPNGIKQGQWCPDCGLKKGTLEEMQLLARERGGKCLSQEYRGALAKLLWECAEGHQWEAKPTKIKEGTWCWTCYLIRRANQRKLKALKKKRGSAFSHSL